MKRKLQVFVSSTFQDLVEERQAAVSAILKSGHIPAGMELFTSGDKSQMDTIQKWIDESDVYMLILGGRYGSIEPTSGVSYTELEYEYAIEHDKPLFAVVINEDALETKVKTHGTEMLERENPSQLEMFRQKVLSNISSFFDDTKDIKLCVYESLSDFSSNRDLKGWVSAGEIANTQSLLDEIGRLNGDLSDVKEQLEDAQKRVAEPQKNTSLTEELEELSKVLKNIEVTLPEHLNSGGEAVTKKLLALFLAAKESLIVGITNQHGISETQSFFYHNLCPKLAIHGLMQNEKITGVRYRRFVITKKGMDFLAYVERKNVPSK